MEEQSTQPMSEQPLITANLNVAPRHYCAAGSATNGRAVPGEILGGLMTWLIYHY